MDESDALIALAQTVEPGDVRAGRAIARGGALRLVQDIHARRSGLNAEDALAMRLELAAVRSDVAREAAAACDARVVTRLDREWPSQLDALGDATPLALWVRGAADLRLLALRSVAVVGARACTPYGEEVARAWSAALADEGWTVVSGAAFGIDAAAHRGALAAGGVSVAVVAGGVDVAYPRAHQSLLDRIADEGLVVSETPLGQPVRRQRFLSRNRVIAALTRATLVVEAAERSGTRATARAAAALERPVVAVPGPVSSPASAGCHRMIRDGEALIATGVDDLRGLVDLGTVARPTTPGAEDRARDQLTVRERAVLDAVPGRGVISLDVLVREAALGTSDVLAAVGTLVTGGWLAEEAGGWRLPRRPRA